MITRKEFLLTADADHEIAAQQARDYTVLEPVFITSNTLTVYVVQKSLYAFLSDQAQSGQGALRSICMALMDRLRGVSEFNLSSQLPLGQANRQMLDMLITGFADSNPAESAKLAELKAELESISDRVVHPWPNTTLHDVKIERDACEAKSIEPQGRQAVIELAGEFEPHKPRLMAKNEITGKWQRINNFQNPDNSPCALAGVYACAIPPQFAGWPLEVDDPYGAVI